METYKEDILDVEMTQGQVSRSFAARILGEGDINADRFGVRVTKDGEPYSLEGNACIGYFIRPDGITLAISGAVSGNTAYVELPAAAYAVEGTFSLAIKLRGAGTENTLRIVDGSIVNVTTGEIADPAADFPDLTDYEEAAEEASEAAAIIDGLSVVETLITGSRYMISVIKE